MCTDTIYCIQVPWQNKKVSEITAGPETEGIEFSDDGSNILVTNEADNTVTIHDFNSGEIIKTVDASLYGLRPRGIKISPDGQYYIATLEHSDNFIVLDKDFNHGWASFFAVMYCAVLTFICFFLIEYPNLSFFIMVALALLFIILPMASFARSTTLKFLSLFK